MFSREELLALARRQPEALVDILLALQQRVEQLERRVKELESQRAQDSHNSHKPPSSDGYSKNNGVESKYLTNGAANPPPIAAAPHPSPGPGQTA
jgi:hypothetical protein